MQAEYIITSGLHHRQEFNEWFDDLGTRKVCTKPVQFTEGNDQITQAQTERHRNTPGAGVLTMLIPLRLIKIGRFSVKETAANTNMSKSYTFFFLILSYLFRVNITTKIIKSRNKSPHDVNNLHVNRITDRRGLGSHAGVRRSPARQNQANTYFRPPTNSVSLTAPKILTLGKLQVNLHLLSLIAIFVQISKPII